MNTNFGFSSILYLLLSWARLTFYENENKLLYYSTLVKVIEVIGKSGIDNPDTHAVNVMHQHWTQFEQYCQQILKSSSHKKSIKKSPNKVKL